MPDANHFAAVVATLESRLGRMPSETEIAAALRWTHARIALIALGQEAQAAGLVRVAYDENRQRHYSRT